MIPHHSDGACSAEAEGYTEGHGEDRCSRERLIELRWLSGGGGGVFMRTLLTRVC